MNQPLASAVSPSSTGAISCSSASVESRERIRKRPPSGISSEKLAPRPFPTNNLSYFQAFFKKHEGLMPGAYKKQAQ
jgi:hypothetical protein